MGARNMIEYNSPHIQPTPAFNFWHDIKTNVVQRNKWDDGSLSARSANNEETDKVGLFGKLHNRESSFDAKLNARALNESRTQRALENSSNNFLAMAKQNNQKYAARFMYSQVNLAGDDTDSERSQSVGRRSVSTGRQRIQSASERFS